MLWIGCCKSKKFSVEIINQLYRDRCRTMINVWGDSIGVGIVAKLSEKEFDKLDESAEDMNANGESIEPTIVQISKTDAETTKF